jgi:hypothetical protein
MEKNYGNFSMEDMKKLANSDAGRQLMAMLQASHGSTAEAVRKSMASGNTDQARQALAAFLSDPKAQALLQKLEGGKNG